MAEFTKGKWRIVDDNNIFSDDTCIAKISTNSIEDKEREANARLITAAPEMYALLRLVIATYELMLKAGIEENTSLSLKSLDVLDGTVNIADELLAHIDGKTTLSEGIHDKNYDITITNNEANARIIAAASEMYEALKTILDEIPIIAGDSRHDALCEAIFKAQKLIESIDGKEENNERK